MKEKSSLGIKIVGLGFVAVIAIAGLVILFTKTEITGQVSGYQKLGTSGTIHRTPYEACRAVRAGAEDGLVPVWNGVVNPVIRTGTTENLRRAAARTIKPTTLIECVSPTNPNKIYWVETQLAYG